MYNDITRADITTRRLRNFKQLALIQYPLAKFEISRLLVRS